MITDSITNGPNGSGTTSVNRFNELSSEDFLKIMFTELTSQDPTQPQDTSKLLDQVNSLRSIESNVQLMDQINALVGQNKFSSAANLIGKDVQGKNEQLETVQGTVTSVGVEGDQVMLTLDNGERVPFENVEKINLPPSQ